MKGKTSDAHWQPNNQLSYNKNWNRAYERYAKAEMLRELSNQNRFRQEPDGSWRLHEPCDDKTCWRLVGTAAHRMRGDETGTECPVWFKLLCGQVGQLRVPGDGKTRHSKICFGEKNWRPLDMGRQFMYKNSRFGWYLWGRWWDDW